MAVASASGLICGIHLQLLLYSALSNIHDWDRAPYPTAKSPGAQPISCSHFDAARRRAHRQVYSQEEAALDSGGPSSSGCRLRSREVFTRARSLPSAELHLTTRLAKDVFLGGSTQHAYRHISQ